MEWLDSGERVPCIAGAPVQGHEQGVKPREPGGWPEVTCPLSDLRFMPKDVGASIWHSIRPLLESGQRDGAYLGLGLHGIGFNVWTDAPAVVDELEYRLGLYYGTVGDCNTTFSVVAVQSEPPWTKDSRGAASHEVEIQRHPTNRRWTRSGEARDVGEWRVVEHKETGSTSFASSAARVVLIANPSAEALAKDTRRLIRDVLAAQLITSGAIEFHASGVAIGDRALAIAAPSNGGKTTLLIEMLRTHRASLICNGRLFLRAADRGIQALGVPEHILLRPGTIATYGELAPYSAPWLGDAIAGGKDVWSLGTEKVAVQLRQFLGAYGADVSTNARLDLVAMPNMKITSDGPSVVSADMPAHAVTQHLLDRKSCVRRFWHGAVGPDWVQFEIDRARITGLLERARVVRVLRGRDWAFVGPILADLVETHA